MSEKNEETVKGSDKVMTMLDNVLCKAAVLERTFKGCEQSGIEVDQAFFGGLVKITAEITEEVTDVLNELL